jgi:GT2 family glycosyltransferase
MPKKTELTIIILTYNSQFWLKKTLSTLKEFYLDHAKHGVEVVVVDNHSTDESVTMLKKEFRWTELIEMPENSGFAAGNNVALKQVTSPYAMLLNSDMEFTERSNLDPLIEYLESHPKVGVITPRIEFTNGAIDPASHRGEPELWPSFTYFSKLEWLFPRTKKFGQYHQFYKDLKSIHTIDACSGAAMIVRMEAVDKVGLLDERFFMYAEDLDWCKRFREAGYTIVYNPETIIIHHKYKSGIKSSSKKIASQTTRHFYDTMLQYYDKHYQNKYPKFVRTIIRYFLAIKKEGI